MKTSKQTLCVLSQAGQLDYMPWLVLSLPTFKGDSLGRLGTPGKMSLRTDMDTVDKSHMEGRARATTKLVSS